MPDGREIRIVETSPARERINQVYKANDDPHQIRVRPARVAEHALHEISSHPFEVTGVVRDRRVGEVGLLRRDQRAHVGGRERHGERVDALWRI